MPRPFHLSPDPLTTMTGTPPPTHHVLLILFLYVSFSVCLDISAHSTEPISFCLDRYPLSSPRPSPPPPPYPPILSRLLLPPPFPPLCRNRPCRFPAPYLVTHGGGRLPRRSHAPLSTKSRPPLYPSAPPSARSLLYKIRPPPKPPPLPSPASPPVLNYPPTAASDTPLPRRPWNNHRSSSFGTVAPPPLSLNPSFCQNQPPCVMSFAGEALLEVEVAEIIPTPPLFSPSLPPPLSPPPSYTLPQHASSIENSIDEMLNEYISLLNPQYRTANSVSPPISSCSDVRVANGSPPVHPTYAAGSEGASMNGGQLLASPETREGQSRKKERKKQNSQSNSSRMNDLGFDWLTRSWFNPQTYIDGLSTFNIPPANLATGAPITDSKHRLSGYCPRNHASKLFSLLFGSTYVPLLYAIYVVRRNFKRSYFHSMLCPPQLGTSRCGSTRRQLYGLSF